MSKGYLYIMSTAKRWKVGLSNDPNKRFGQLKNAATPDLKLHASFPTGNMAKAEQMAHDRLKEMGLHVDGEVFEGSTYADVEQVVAASAAMYATAVEDVKPSELTFDQKCQKVEDELRALNEVVTTWDCTDRQRKRSLLRVEELGRILSRLVDKKMANEYYSKAQKAVLVAELDMSTGKELKLVKDSIWGGNRWQLINSALRRQITNRSNEERRAKKAQEAAEADRQAQELTRTKAQADEQAQKENLARRFGGEAGWSGPMDQEVKFSFIEKSATILIVGSMVFVFFVEVMR